ncbi:MAG: hypothetical protein N3A58_08510 [Spirochaetes bacterium]|nr:hypothetical protein [Spirochaetota bacterium]
MGRMKNIKINKKYIKNKFLIYNIYFIFFISFIFIFSSCKKREDLFSSDNNKNREIFSYIKDINYEVIYILNDIKFIYSNDYDEGLIYKGIIKAQYNYNFPLTIIENKNKKESRLIDLISKNLNLHIQDKGEIIIGCNLDMDFELFEFFQKNKNLYLLNIITDSQKLERANIFDYQEIKKEKINNISIITLDYKSLGNFLQMFLNYLFEKRILLINIEGFQNNFSVNLFFNKEKFYNYDFKKGFEESYLSNNKFYIFKTYDINLIDFNNLDRKKLLELFSFNKRCYINIINEEYLDKFIKFVEEENLKNILFIPLFSKSIDENHINYIPFLFYINWINVVSDFFDEIINFSINLGNGNIINKYENSELKIFQILKINEKYLNIVPNYNSLNYFFSEEKFIENFFISNFF